MSQSGSDQNQNQSQNPSPCDQDLMELTPHDKWLVDHIINFQYFGKPKPVVGSDEYNLVVAMCQKCKQPEADKHLSMLSKKIREVKGIRVEESIICVICLDECLSSERLVRLHCGHRYHFGCLYEWLKKKNTCPVCRRIACQR